MAALLSFASFHLLYLANVKLLPGEHYLAGKSLVVDLLIVATLIVASVPLLRSSLVQSIRVRLGDASAVFGAALLIGSTALLVWVWPRAKPDPQRQGEGPNLLLIVMDSVRRDRLSLGGEAHPATPLVHALARHGRAYTSAWASSSWTVPSVSSMLGADNDAAGNGATLAVRLASRGYVTACFTDNPHLAGGGTLMKGFDRVERSVGSWRSILRGTVLGEIIERVDPGSDGRLAGRVLRWASGRRGPFFLYVHLMDSHTPYRFPPIDGRRRRGRRIEFPITGMALTPEEAQDVEARYDGGVRSADAQVERILAAASHWGRPFVAVVTSDHGESLGETGRWFHGQTLAPELLAIPLLVVGKGVVPGRAEAAVGHDAVMTTLLAAAGVACPDCSGPDLRSSAGSGVVDGALPPRLAYRIAGRYKVVVDAASGERHLFDLRADPGERRDLAAERPQVVEAMCAGLTGGFHRVDPTPEGAERLRSLGYSGS